MNDKTTEILNLQDELIANMRTQLGLLKQQAEQHEQQVTNYAQYVELLQNKNSLMQDLIHLQSTLIDLKDVKLSTSIELY